MKKQKLRYSDYWAFPLVITISFVMVLGLAPHGAATTDDSLYYINAAENLVSGRGLVQLNFDLTPVDYRPFTTWPPLYPLILSMLMSTGNSAEAAAKYLNMIMLGISVIIFLMLSKRITGGIIAVILAVVFLLQTPILTVFTYCWSESLFIPLVLSVYLFGIKFMDSSKAFGSEKSLHWLFLSVISLVLACYTRYIGLAFLPMLICMIVLAEKNSWTKAIMYACLATLVTVVSLLHMFIRNLAYTGYVSGAQRGIPENHLLADGAMLAKQLMVNLAGFHALVAVIFSLLLTALCIFLIFRFSMHRRLNNRAERIAVHAREMLLPLGWVFSYCFALVILRSVQKIDIDTRMISVVIPFLLLALIAIAKQITVLAPKSVALAPFVFLLSMQVVHGIITYNSAIKSWREESSPNFISSGTDVYTNFTSNIRYQVIRKLYDDLRSANFDRPVIFYDWRPIQFYYYTGAQVKGMPAALDTETVIRINQIGAKGGFILITTQEGKNTMVKAYGNDWVKVDGFKIVETGIKGITVISLPLPIPHLQPASDAGNTFSLT